MEVKNHAFYVFRAFLKPSFSDEIKGGYMILAIFGGSRKSIQKLVQIWPKTGQNLARNRPETGQKPARNWPETGRERIRTCPEDGQESATNRPKSGQKQVEKVSQNVAKTTFRQAASISPSCPR